MFKDKDNGRGQRGAIMVFFAILLPVLFGFMGLAIDASVLYVQKAKLQDVADAAALAGAAHMDEGDLEIGEAVLAYVEDNGLGVDRSGGLEIADEASSAGVTVAYGIPADKADRVRVRLTRLVPTFFINVVTDAFRDGVQITAVAAAAGEGDGYAGKPAIIGSGEVNIYGNPRSKVDSNGNHFTYDVYGKEFNMYGKENLNMDGDIYSGNTPGDIKNGQGAHYDLDDAENKKVQEMEEYVAETMKKYSSLAKEINPADYGSGNKIYISKDGVKPNGFVVNQDTAYEVYVDAVGMSGDKGKVDVIASLYGIKKVKTLAIKSDPYKPCRFEVDDVDFGDVYILSDDVFIEGEGNKFNGVIYSDYEVNVAGSQSPNKSNNYSQLISKTVNVGVSVKDDGTLDTKSKDKIKFEIGSGEGEGSSDSGSSKLRLVE